MITNATILNDRSAHKLAAGAVEALFIPHRGMLCASLRHRGEELLRRVDDLDAAAAKGSTAGIPLLHPWANRLAETRILAAGRDVSIDSSSPLLHFDEHHLLIHGVPWAMLKWETLEADHTRVVAQLDWSLPELLRVFPFRHTVGMTATLEPSALLIETAVHADRGEAVPVSFGFHPYFGVPGVPRADWRITLPAMHHLTLDARGIPTGGSTRRERCDDRLGDRTFDDGFELDDEQARFTISANGRAISVEFIRGYRFAQIYAPRGKDLIAIEPMTAPTNALVSGRALPVAEPGGAFKAEFRVRIEERRQRA